jgi:death-on-curing protein
LFRPQTGYYETLVDEAAALWESLSQNHPFVDGNKRTAFAATFVFLAINGLDVTASDEDSQADILDLYDAGSVNFANLQSWLLNNTART